MIEQGLFKKYFVGRDGFYWWIGQIAPEESWSENKRGIPGKDNKDTPGYAERYKVRIMGHHTAVPSELPDDDLPWATVMYPVTAGGGTGSSSQTANLRQGMFVFGFFMDGEDGQQPVIFGVLGTNSYTAIMAEVPDAKFIPFTGTSVQKGERIATYSRKAKDSEGEVAPAADEAKGKPKQNETVIDSTEGAQSEVEDAASAESAKEPKKKPVPIPKPSHCSPIPLAGIQLTLGNTIKDIEDLRGTLTDYRLAATKGVKDVQGEIEEKKALARKQIMGYLKWVIDEMIKHGEGLANEINKAIQGFLGSQTVYLGQIGFNKTVEAVVCAIKALFKALFEYLGDLVNDIIDKVINVATCFVENFVAGILAQIDNLITQFINSLFNAVYGAINAAFNIGDQVLGVATSIVSFIQDVLSILSCEAEDGCEEWRTQEWSILTGGRTGREDLESVMNKVKSLSSSFNQVFDFTNGITDVLENQFEFDLSGIFDVDGCDIGPILCGPPQLQIFGGTGAGFVANPVISDSGSIIGVDIVSVGSGYGDGDYAKIVDQCGNGNGTWIDIYRGNSPWDFWNWLNDGDPGDGDSDLLGDGIRGITSPFWGGLRGQLGPDDEGPGGPGVGNPQFAGIRRPSDSGGAGGPGIVNPVFADGPIFEGRIGPGRLAIRDPGVLRDGLTTSVRVAAAITDPGFGTVFRLGIGTGIGTIRDDTSVGFPTSPVGFFTAIHNPSWDRGAFPGLIGTDRFEAGSISTSLSDPAFAKSIKVVGIGTTIGVYSPAYEDRPEIGVSTAAINAILNPTFETSVGIRTYRTLEPTDVVTDPPGSGIVGVIIRQGGSDFLKKPDGSLGGMGRVWATAAQTKVLKPNGTYLKPIDPGSLIRLSKGDTVEIPEGSVVLTEPSDSGEGGKEEIVGGVPYVMQNDGIITAPSPGAEGFSRRGGLAGFPAASDGTYPVIMYMMGFIVDDPGVKYEEGDEIVIEPALGAKAELRVTPQGGIRSIKITQQGEGYKELPNVYIKSKNGIGARLLPQLGVNRVSDSQMSDPEIASKAISVMDGTNAITSVTRPRVLTGAY